MLTPNGGPPATVMLVEPTGSETQVLARLGDTPIHCTFRERITAGPGDTIRILPDMSLVAPVRWRHRPPHQPITIQKNRENQE